VPGCSCNYHPLQVTDLVSDTMSQLLRLLAESGAASWESLLAAPHWVEALPPDLEPLVREMVGGGVGSQWPGHAHVSYLLPTL
jgi:hypothetical protein